MNASTILGRDARRSTPAARPYAAIPEPPRRSALGHLTEWLGVDNARGVLGRLLRYGEQCGPLARVSLGPARMLVIADPQIANEVLAADEANYKGMAYILTRAVLDNVLLLNGEAWATSRTLYRQAFRDVDALASVEALLPSFVARMKRAEGRGPVAMDQELLRLTGDVVGDFVAGVRHTDAFEPHRRRVQYELAAIGIDLQCQPWTYFNPARWVELRRSVGYARRFFADAAERRSSQPDGARADVLAGFLALAREGRYPKGRAKLQEGLVNSFFTAHDVLNAALTWCVYLVAAHPEVQARLRASLHASLQGAAEGPEARAAIEGDVYLGCVVKEALRLYPGYPLFGRTTQAEMVIGGYRVPKRTMLIVTPFVMHRLARYWPEPGRFDPERWRGRALGTPPPRAKEAFMPFGAGERGCLGFHLAFPVIKAIVARLVRDLVLTTAEGHAPQLAYLGTAYSESGMPIHVAAAPAAPAATRAPDAPSTPGTSSAS